MLTDDGITSELNKVHSARMPRDRATKLEQPLRMELFSLQQRRERGQALGQEHHAGPVQDGGDTLLARLKDNEAVLRSVHRQLVDEVNHNRPITPVAEWIVDNFYVIEEQVSMALRHLPRKYLMELPRLSNPGKEGTPRVYDLAEHVIAYGDSRVDTTDLSVLVSAYQEVKPLKLGELWAVPIMLRLALIENIRRMAVLVAHCQSERATARLWADRLVRVESENPKDLVVALADMARSGPELSGPFVAEFKRRLQGRGMALRLPLQWIEQNLAERERSLDQVVTDENHEQAVLEISMRNCVTSLRALNVTDWNEFVETMSRVERYLRRDPADVYGKMDFATRDVYRTRIERLARRSGEEEVAVAAACLDLARNGVAIHGARSPEAHVGYYLIGKGERDLRAAIRYSGSLGDRIREASTRWTLFLYLGAIVLLTAFFTAVTTFLVYAGGVRGDMLLVLGILLAFTTGHLAVGLVNLLATQIVRPRALARLDFRKGIPAEMRTLVVVPLMLTSEKGVGEMLRMLETHYLNNRGENIHFGLLTDFADSDSEHQPEDSRLLNLCRLGILRLNDKYPEDGGDNFFLFHRGRKWNAQEGKWMGWERKRGKLEDLNRYLRGTDPDAFACVEGLTHMLSNVRYVITLDADTAMARQSAHKMVGAMAHPLNQPRYDRRLGRVVAGHGILQPRVDATISGANRSLYARMNAGDAGLDPYTFASSDVYQDLFDEGSFIGKGIYDVEMFDRALGGRFPDNKILSHDLIEGCVVRSGLLATVKLYEDPPNTYLMDMQRRHRWVRGDWQIASYLLAKEIRGGRQADTKPLNVLSQWKVIDNLRRSVTPIMLFLLLVVGLVAMKNPGLYIAVVACAILGPVLIAGLCGLCKKSQDKTISQHVRNSCRGTSRDAAQVLFKFACLPFESYVNADAIVRSLWRQCISRKHLLQWNPSDNKTPHPDRVKPLYVYSRMWICPVAALAMVAVLAATNGRFLLYALPILALWFLAPWFASYLSRPRKAKTETLTDKQRAFLRETARRTWAFFESFVNADENWLPPDNFQEEPGGRIAHRTSPTNMGMSLLSNLAAYDFGYVSAGKLVDRSEKALETMSRLERYRGHFYNWYDTRRLEVLRPAYVSSVDSGNLAAHALVLASGLRELPSAPVVNMNVFAGFVDTLCLARQGMGRVSLAGKDLSSADKLFRDAAAKPPETPADYIDRLHKLEARAKGLRDTYADASGNVDNGQWFKLLFEQIRDARTEAELFMPWAALLEQHPDWTNYASLQKIPTLFQTAEFAGSLLEPYDDERDDAAPPELANLLASASERARARLGQLQHILGACEDIANIEFDFLYNKSNRLLSIGFNVSDNRQDNSFYDLLASEARLAAYLGIAQNKLPQESWFALGRLLTLSGRRPLLISWSGSMFEYLMPLLVMPTYDDTLLDETYKASVEVQMDYAADRGVPWGVSESGYYLFDSDRNYQYRAFGVPELGLRHTLAEELVIAPYATALAAMVFPRRAAANLRRLAEKGYVGQYGFYEAVDFTPSRMEKNQTEAIVRSYMSHHQGMSLVALAQALLGNPMHRRFRANPLLNSASMLLQEIVPAERAMYFHSSFSPEIHPKSGDPEMAARVVGNPNASHPDVQLLSNGRYHVMVTAAGSGYSRWRDLSLTRWREDVTRDNWGMYCYLRDRDTGDVWSNTHQPTRKTAQYFEAVFSEGKAEFHRRDGDFECKTEIVVAPEDDVEVRRLRITNRSNDMRHLDVTSYAEVALAGAAADDSHPAFSKLFVQTRYVSDRQAIVCTRRPRSAEDHTPALFHMMAVRGTAGGEVSYETDRLRFLGRGRDAAIPAALDETVDKLENSHGAVLDPVIAVRTDVTLNPGETAVVDMITGVAETPDALETLLEKYQDERSADKAFDLAWSHSQLLLRQLAIPEQNAQRYCQLASSILYANPILRAEAGILLRNRKGQSGLWSYAISGDLPIVLLKVTDPSRVNFVEEMLQAHNYWRQKGLAVDMVIWNEDQSGYRQTLHDQITSLAGTIAGDADMEKPGGVFIRSAERISDEDRILVQSVARIVLSDSDGMLEDQMRKLLKAELIGSSTLVQYRKNVVQHDEDVDTPVEDLLFSNGYGGFSQDGTEYVVVTEGDARPPLPWVNVIANPSFGCVVSEAGSSYTWSVNAHEYRITPWYNDPVSDAGGEALYLRDEESGEFWSPAPFPCRSPGRYVARHGFGYSEFHHNAHGITSRMTVHVDKDESVKFVSLHLTNNSRQRRSLSVTAFVEWVLGEMRHKTAQHVITGADSRSGALFARNQYNTEFRGRTVFLDVDDPGRTVTGDRNEFLGRNGDPANPFAMQRSQLSGRVGPGLDPCGAVQVKFNLGPGQEREVVVRLGAGESVEDARRLIRKFRGLDAARQSLRQAKEAWKECLSVVRVETPDKAFDIMANGWLPYQVLSCRFWGRSATYQSGGAFGFRDQLQDSIALLYAEPSLVRQHLLESAGRQFTQGDVQHWWHPPAGRGVRTRCSDDYLWLPYVAERYVTVTGDTGVLDEKVRFIDGRPLRDGEESYYDLPANADEWATLYDHCKRSIVHGLRFGAHGLPLMGSGDWNDGMDLVGINGKGESVWLGFFLHDVLTRFEPIARQKGDQAFADRCRSEAETLATNIEENAWDEAWYRRAYFDDGTPLGSVVNDECRIDSIVQSWSVLSGVGGEKRVRSAMRSLNRRLVDHDNMVVKLFEPPFNSSPLNPGYIKGYVPGVRENGGQYTHGAIWAGMAYAKLGDRAMAWEMQRILNPVSHGMTREVADVYKVEPYVISADVYANPQHVGRGGWSWYTGSASWMYRFMLESILGFDLTVDSIRVRPCVPENWDSFRIRFRRRHSLYDIKVTQNKLRDVAAREVDEGDGRIPIADDAREHSVEIRL